MRDEAFHPEALEETVMKEKLGKEDVNLIICHIGSGSSIACIKDGKCYKRIICIPLNFDDKEYRYLLANPKIVSKPLSKPPDGLSM